ncbi:unnamed protein product [Closterium sp. Naga37s-1]|nr:unnamed protein product [Closterium sp. Naga37s-1]
MGRERAREGCGAGGRGGSLVERGEGRGGASRPSQSVREREGWRQEAGGRRSGGEAAGEAAGEMNRKWGGGRVDDNENQFLAKCATPPCSSSSSSSSSSSFLSFARLSATHPRSKHKSVSSDFSADFQFQVARAVHEVEAYVDNQRRCGRWGAGGAVEETGVAVGGSAGGAAGRAGGGGGSGVGGGLLPVSSMHPFLSPDERRSGRRHCRTGSWAGTSFAATAFDATSAAGASGLDVSVRGVDPIGTNGNSARSSFRSASMREGGAVGEGGVGGGGGGGGGGRGGGGGTGRWRGVASSSPLSPASARFFFPKPSNSSPSREEHGTGIGASSSSNSRSFRSVRSPTLERIFGQRKHRRAGSAEKDLGRGLAQEDEERARRLKERPRKTAADAATATCGSAAADGCSFLELSPSKQASEAPLHGGLRATRAPLERLTLLMPSGREEPAGRMGNNGHFDSTVACSVYADTNPAAADSSGASVPAACPPGFPGAAGGGSEGLVGSVLDGVCTAFTAPPAANAAAAPGGLTPTSVPVPSLSPYSSAPPSPRRSLSPCATHSSSPSYVTHLRSSAPPLPSHRSSPFSPSSSSSSPSSSSSALNVSGITHAASLPDLLAPFSSSPSSHPLRPAIPHTPPAAAVPMAAAARATGPVGFQVRAPISPSARRPPKCGSSPRQPIAHPLATPTPNESAVNESSTAAASATAECAPLPALPAPPSSLPPPLTAPPRRQGSRRMVSFHAVVKVYEFTEAEDEEE